MKQLVVSHSKCVAVERTKRQRAGFHVFGPRFLQFPPFPSPAADHLAKKHSLSGYDIDVEIGSDSLSVAPVPGHCVATGQSWSEGVLPSGHARGPPALKAPAWLCSPTSRQRTSLRAPVCRTGSQKPRRSWVTIKPRRWAQLLVRGRCA